MPARGERRRLAPEERRAQILDAAFRCFGEKGYHASRMDDLVRASGLSKGNLYLHFESKEAVFLALFDAFEAEVFAAWEEEAEHTAGALALLRREGEIVLERMLSQRMLVAAWMEFLTHPAARDRLQLTYERTRARLVALLARGVGAGELRGDLPLEEVAALFTGAIEGLVLQAFVDPAFDARGCFDRTFTVYEKGIAR